MACSHGTALALAFSDAHEAFPPTHQVRGSWTCTTTPLVRRSANGKLSRTVRNDKPPLQRRLCRLAQRLVDDFSTAMRTASSCAASVALVCAMGLALCSCKEGEDAELEAEFVGLLRVLLREPGEVARFDLNSATTFDWDVVHVFRPYTRETAIREAIASDIDDRRIHRRDDINLFVFTRNGRAVLTAEVPRGVCDVWISATDSSNRRIRVGTKQAWFEMLVDDSGHCRMIPAHTLRD